MRVFDQFEQLAVTGCATPSQKPPLQQAHDPHQFPAEPVPGRFVLRLTTKCSDAALFLDFVASCIDLLSPRLRAEGGVNRSRTRALFESFGAVALVLEFSYQSALIGSREICPQEQKLCQLFVFGEQEWHRHL